MTFVNRLGAITPGQGSGVQNDALFLKQTIVLSTTGTQTVVVPSTGAFVPAITKGKLRAKFSDGPNPGTNPAVTTCSFVLSDGVNFTEVARYSSGVLAVVPSSSMPNYADRVSEFEIDFPASYLYIVSNLSGTSPVMLLDVEVSATA